MTLANILPLADGAMGIVLIVLSFLLVLAILRLKHSVNRLRAVYDAEILRILARPEAEAARKTVPPHQSSGGNLHG
jgi:hypothetical protein